MAQIGSILHCLDKFCASSGSKVSGSKAKLYFSKNVSVELANSTCRKSGFENVNCLGKYLGTPPEW